METLKYQEEENLGIITLNRPKSLNAISLKMREEMELLLDNISKENKIRALILKGHDNFFCAGADIKEKPGIMDKVSENALYRIITRKTIIHSLLEDYEKPIIAAVSGLALGGGLELALACDLLIASETATFGLPEINLGGLPAGGGTQRLPRLIGLSKAKEMIMTGESIDAQEAYRIGLVNKVFPVESLLEETKKIAQKIAEKAPLSITMAKVAMNKGSQIDLNSALDLEAQCVTVLNKTEDRLEARNAFNEKRKPNFKNK